MTNEKKRLGWWLLGVGVIVIAVSAIFVVRAKWTDTPNGELKTVSLRLKWIHQGQFAGFYVADRLGYYNDEGLKVVIRPGGQDFNAVRLVASGDDQFGVWGAEQLMISRSENIKILSLGTVYQDTAACFVAREDSGIKGIKDLIGKRVGTQRGTDVETIYTALTKINGLDRGQVKERNVSYNFSLFLAGEFDVWPCYVMNEPYTARQNGVKLHVINPKDNGLRFYGDTIFCAEDYAKKNDQVVRGFMRATAKGWDYALNHPDEAAKICLEVDPHLNLDHQAFMIRESKPFIRPSGQPLLRMSDERWMEIHRVLKDQGLIKRDVSVSEVYTNDFLPD